MATEVENNVPAPVETKEIKEEAPVDNKADEKTETAAEAPAAAKEPAPPKVLVHKNSFEKDVVYLYQFSRTPLLPSVSPYCLKVETWLRLAGLKYEVSALHISIILFINSVRLLLSVAFKSTLKLRSFIIYLA